MASTLVADANVVIDALVHPGTCGQQARLALAGHKLGAPEHLRIEVCNVIRRLVAAGIVGDKDGKDAVGLLGRWPIDTVPTTAILERIWDLKNNLTSYDAAYVAAAEYLGVDLLSCDNGILAAPGINCPIHHP